MPVSLFHFYIRYNRSRLITVTVKPWPKTLNVKHLRFALQTMFNRFVTSQSIAWQAELAWRKHFLLAVSIKYLMTNVLWFGQAIKHFLDKQIWDVWPTMFDRLTRVLGLVKWIFSKLKFVLSSFQIRRIQTIYLKSTEPAACSRRVSEGSERLPGLINPNFFYFFANPRIEEGEVEEQLVVDGEGEGEMVY